MAIYNSQSFIVKPSPSDDALKLKTTDGSITVVVKPHEVSTTSVIRNFIVIKNKFNNNVIHLSFIDKNDALSGNEILMYWIDYLKAQNPNISTDIETYVNTKLLSYSTQSGTGGGGGGTGSFVNNFDFVNFNNTNVIPTPVTNTYNVYLFNDDLYFLNSSGNNILIGGSSVNASFSEIYTDISNLSISVSNAYTDISNLSISVSNAYDLIGGFSASLYVNYPTQSTGTIIDFQSTKDYGSPTSPETTNITFNFTGAKKAVQRVFHNSAITPTIPTEGKRLGGIYVTGSLNIIIFDYFDNNNVYYSISQVLS